MGHEGQLETEELKAWYRKFSKQIATSRGGLAPL